MMLEFLCLSAKYFFLKKVGVCASPEYISTCENKKIKKYLLSKYFDVKKKNYVCDSAMYLDNLAVLKKI
ncbi:hypothetical protein BDF21DRAFT_406304, partial [Thamnidium elegans]